MGGGRLGSTSCPLLAALPFYSRPPSRTMFRSLLSTHRDPFLQNLVPVLILVVLILRMAALLTQRRFERVRLEPRAAIAEVAEEDHLALLAQLAAVLILQHLLLIPRGVGRLFAAFLLVFWPAAPGCIARRAIIKICLLQSFPTSSPWCAIW